MDEERWKQLRSQLLHLHFGLGVLIVLLAVACYLLWQINDALHP